MTIYDKYTTKRKKFKDGHYYVITYNENGKKIGHARWHSTNKKGESPSEIIKVSSVKNYNKILAKKETPYKKWKEHGYSVPKITFTEKNMRFEFSYEILLKGINEMDEKTEKWITIQDRTPLTKEQIISKIDKFLLTDYHFKKVTSKGIKNLILSKEFEYQDEYKPKLISKRR